MTTNIMQENFTCFHTNRLKLTFMYEDGMLIYDIDELQEQVQSVSARLRNNLTFYIGVVEM
jgi:hypothetical protein